MNENKRISAEQAAKAVRAWVPTAAEVRLAPGDVSDGTGEVRVNSTWVSFWTPLGTWIEDVTLPVSEMLLRVLSALPGRVRTQRQTFNVATANWLPFAPVTVVSLAGLSVPEALAPAADPYRAAQLDAQRHKLDDPAEPPLLSDGDVSTAADYPGWVPPHTDTAVDCARSLADGHMTPADWSVCDPQPAPAREAEDVPVIGGAL